MKKLDPKEIQEGKVFHNSEHSVKVLEIKTVEPYSSPRQVVLFQSLNKHTGPTGLPMELFCKQYQRKKR